MTATNFFALRKLEAPKGQEDYATPRSVVLLDGSDTGVVIDGATLEAQFALESSRHLLLVTDDTPYEETMRAYLLGDRNEILDRATLSYAYTGGIVREIRATGGDSIEFQFAGDARFRLTVHAEPHHIWNASGGITEAFRFLSGRHIEITREAGNV